MKQVAYWGHTDIRHHRKNVFSPQRPGAQHLCTPVFNFLVNPCILRGEFCTYAYKFCRESWSKKACVLSCCRRIIVKVTATEIRLTGINGQNRHAFVVTVMELSYVVYFHFRIIVTVRYWDTDMIFDGKKTYVWYTLWLFKSTGFCCGS